MTRDDAIQKYTELAAVAKDLGVDKLNFKQRVEAALKAAGVTAPQPEQFVDAAEEVIAGLQATAEATSMLPDGLASLPPMPGTVEVAKVEAAEVRTAPTNGTGVVAEPVAPPPVVTLPPAPPSVAVPPTTAEVMTETVRADVAAAAKEKQVLNLPPSFLVIQSVSTPGDVSYETVADERTMVEAVGDDGVDTSKRVRTSKQVVVNPQEYEAAKKLAGQMRTALRQLGNSIQQGVVLVPVAREKELDKLIEQCDLDAINFNASARHHFVRPSIQKTVVTTDAEKTARDVAFQIQEKMDRLKEAMDKCDVKQIQNVTSQLKNWTKVLNTPKDKRTITAAIDAARTASKWIREETTKKGRLIEDVRQEINAAPVDTARIMFLEYAAPPEMEVARSSVEAGRFSDMLEATTGEPADVKPAINVDRFADMGEAPA